MHYFCAKNQFLRGLAVQRRRKSFVCSLRGVLSRAVVVCVGCVGFGEFSARDYVLQLYAFVLQCL